MRRLRWAVPAAVLVLSAGVGVTARAASGAAPAGPDVSSYQHPGGSRIDWARVRQGGARFTFVKATEGHTYTNPYFSDDYAQAQNQGLVRSAYHFARPARPLSTATQQADYFASRLAAPQQGDLPATLDLEEAGGLSPSELVSWTKTFVERLAALTGRPPLIYTYPYFWRHALGDSHAFTSYPLWIADYSNGSHPGPLPGGWQTWTFWQTTSSGRQPGISNAVDLDRFNGDDAALQRLATPAGASPAPSGLPVPLPTVVPTVVPTGLPTLHP